jgi:DnaJ family protein C protein 28
MASTEDLNDLPDWTAGIAERKIQQALEEGLFDNLPGHGKPLDLSANPFEPPGMGAINRLLRHNRVLPPWVMLEQEIEASRALALATLARWDAAAEGLRETPDYPQARAAARTAYEKHMRVTNDMVLKYNYSSPFALRAPIPLMLKARLREFDERYGTDDSSS